MSRPRRHDGRLPWRGGKVKHFKTKQPAIHMLGRENRVRPGKVNRHLGSFRHLIYLRQACKVKTLASCSHRDRQR